MLAHKPFEWGMKHVNWSFLEAGRGNGAADGIGGVLKRTTDRIVAQGTDLPNAEAVFECLSRNTNVCLFYVTDTDVSRMDEYLNMVILRPIPGTMAFHQLIFDWLETCTARASFTEATEAPAVDVSLLHSNELTGLRPDIGWRRSQRNPSP